MGWALLVAAFAVPDRFPVFLLLFSLGELVFFTGTAPSSVPCQQYAYLGFTPAISASVHQLGSVILHELHVQCTTASQCSCCCSARASWSCSPAPPVQVAPCSLHALPDPPIMHYSVQWSMVLHELHMQCLPASQCSCCWSAWASWSSSPAPPLLVRTVLLMHV